MSVKESSRGSVTILAPQVDLDGLGYANLKEACERMVEEGKHQVVLDLTQVHYINSICIGYLVQFWQRLLNKRGFLAVVGCQEGVNRLISYSGIDKKIPFHADVDTAIAAHENGEGAGEEIDETAFYALLSSYVRVGLCTLIGGNVAETDPARFGVSGWQVTLTGDIEGTIGISIDSASGEKLRALVAGKFEQDDSTTQDTNAYVLDTLFGSACSGIGEMGYEIEHGPIEQTELSSDSRPAQLDFGDGEVGLAFNLVLRGTKRNRAIPLES